MAYIEPTVGRYVHVEVDGTAYRTYFEVSGDGIPLVCLHTAGADSTLYRHLLADDDVTRDFQVVAFDMPWHGRSLPPDGWWRQEYKLTQRFYIDFVIAFSEALGLGRPVLMGSSMGGYLMLDIAYSYPDRFGGLIAVDPRAHEPFWATLSDYFVMPEVNPSNLIRPLVRSLLSPEAPEAHRREVEWLYSRCGPGVLGGALHFAAEDHDARRFLDELDAEVQGLYALRGEHDWSINPEQSRELERIKGFKEIRIPNTGHFPSLENPVEFKCALMPVLNDLKARLA